jgi:hypothetical protein
LKTLVEFREITNLSKRFSTFLCHIEMSCLPLPNEVVNIHGSPYIVQQRAFALPDNSSSNKTIYVYIEVVKGFWEKGAN